MTSASEAASSIFLQPLPDTDSVPLRRWLGRESWRRDPVISMGYEPDGDRILFRLIDSPSTASGIVDAVRATRLDGELFIGFDGTDSRAWPTTIVMLDFGRHRDQGTSLLLAARELVGGRSWTAALSLRAVGESEHEIRLSDQEAAELISRWTELVVGPIFEAADAVLAEWSAEMTEQALGGPTADEVAPGSASSGAQAAQAQASYGALARAVSLMPRLPDSGRGSADGDSPAGRQIQEPMATGVATAMAHRSPTSYEEPRGPMPYGIWARLTDIWCARRDGHNVVPPIPAPGANRYQIAMNHAVTPYMEVRNRHFLDWAERERRRMYTELTRDYQRRAEIKEEAAGAEKAAEKLQQVAENLPTEPPEPLRRNAVEQNAPEALIRARRQREFKAEQDEILAPYQEAARKITKLREEAAGLEAKIEARQEILYSQVRQLHQHALLRCGTYMQHIVLHHPEGSAVIPYLSLALPELPAWVPPAPLDGIVINGQVGLQSNGHGGPRAIASAGSESNGHGGLPAIDLVGPQPDGQPGPEPGPESSEPDGPEPNGPDESQGDGGSGAEH